MKIISIMLILIGLYLMISDESNNTSKIRSRKIEYKGKYKDEKHERLVEIINPEWETIHPKKN
jgi:hypothetical protein